MLAFEKAFNALTRPDREGGYSNHPKDPGGITNLGVTKRAYEAWIGSPVTTERMKSLTKKDVKPFYYERYWLAAKCDRMPAPVAYEIFDMAVNHGPGNAAKLLQRTIGATVDGNIGPKTLAELKAHDTYDVVAELAFQRALFCLKITGDDPFDDGWARRIEEVRNEAMAL